MIYNFHWCIIKKNRLKKNKNKEQENPTLPLSIHRVSPRVSYISHPLIILVFSGIIAANKQLHPLFELPLQPPEEAAFLLLRLL